MSIRFIKGDGTVTDGTYTELWFSKTQWRRETEVGDFRRIEIGMDRKRWQLDSSTAAPDHIGEITHLFDFGSFPGKWKPAKDREINGVSAACIEQKSDFGSSALCFTKANGTIIAEVRSWQLSNRVGKQVCSYADYEKYGDHIFPKSYECDEDERPILKVRILELTAAPASDSSLFAPPKGAKESVNCLTPIQPPIVLSAPNLPPPTQSFKGTIVVLVNTVVSTDGRIHDTKVISEPRPPFDETAIAEVRQWRFAPGTCDGKPVESEVVAQVAFMHY
jgi:TonB family protein